MKKRTTKMMTTEKIEKMTEIFAQLMSTDSRNEKNDIVSAIPDELKIKKIEPDQVT